MKNTRKFLSLLTTVCFLFVAFVGVTTPTSNHGTDPGVTTNCILDDVIFDA
ncbi:MAG: hypothetical protein K0S47_361 [Herbinix sp.]|jgi:hypothetical protein|nr:hypothetical protein [Herbinix sp.]